MIPMGEHASKQKFYFRMSGPHYHTFIIHSKFFVFYETTKGPFHKSDTVFAPWAPQENDLPQIEKFMKGIRGKDL